ncbi:polysaccharide pyruvyl transferase family protein [Marinobacter sp. 1_MG-2023]|uniref:polysaccharide pyruvyl transferase family protein n=1 Tax=Marinobacter sp. 1_MG-2023 TaxID=3062627 RepID=UPI0026E46986|nr:polysaccharide pyruvyl transferase family protein [Marinobacter sp. 1_MG-2023]MDO6823300.1 polysaccharide pyruvyl transferase family protein [Marinobacter sp. 1_MG-2023]
MKPYYVLLTGSRNNAGDFLIKHRAKALFAQERSDRDIVDLNAWEPFDKERLDLVNDACAVILMGGPSLRYEMYPEIYRLTKNLADITVPLTLMGVGWKSAAGRWQDTYNYSFSEHSIQLLKKAESSGLPISVRDYHSMNSLRFNSINNVMMTGCPAYYDLDSLNVAPQLPGKISRVGFSLGVSFVQSSQMESQMKQQILACRKLYKDAEFKVLFHHSLELNTTEAAYGSSMPEHLRRHQLFAGWLDSEQIPYSDISGSAQNLIKTYSDIDLHVGYRVHAHIFMNSIGKLSLLLSEDGRAKGSHGAIGGMVVDGYDELREGFMDKVLRRICGKPDPYVPNKHATADMLSMLEYELLSEGQRTLTANAAIHQNFLQMKRYLRLLP